MQIEITRNTIDLQAKRIALETTGLGFTKNGKPMVGSQGLRILASLAGYREEHSFVAALKAETLAPQSDEARNLLGALFSYLTRNYGDDQWDASTRELLEEAAEFLGEPKIEWSLPEDEEEAELGPMPSREAVAEWVGLHYGVNFEAESAATQDGWIYRYRESHPAAAAQDRSAVADAVAQLEAQWGYEYERFPRRDWQYEVGNDDTRLGYWEWVAHQIELYAEDDSEETTEAAPAPLTREEMYAKADRAFEAHNFGDRIVGESDGWEYDGRRTLTRNVYLEDPDNLEADSVRVRFTVEVSDDGLVRVFC